MAIGDFYRAVLEYRRSDGSFLGETVHVYRQETAHVEPTPSLDLANAILDEALTDVMNPLPTVVSVAIIRVRGITEPSEGADLSFVAVAGTQTGEVYDWAMGLRMVWRTGLIGRSFQGRTTFPPTTEANVVSGGTLNTGFQGNAQILLSSLINLPSSASHGEWQMVIMSTRTGGAERPSPIFTTVTAGELQTRQGILRQRRD